MEAFGVDEFGREHVVVEAAPGRLCLTLGETEKGFVVVRGFDQLSPDDLAGWDDGDRKRVLLLRDTVSVGDRLVGIEGEDVVHCGLREVGARLGKLAAKKRRLTFARYHPSPFDSKAYDVEKLVLVHAPKGPLGLLISETVHYGAVVDGFQPLPDGSLSKLARDPKIHRGCQIVNVNGRDVSAVPRENVLELLAAAREEEKDIIFYRATPAACATLVRIELSAADAPPGFTVDDSDAFKCVVATTTTPAAKASLALGDVLIGVNTTDVSHLNRLEALEAVSSECFPRSLYFYRTAPADLPECHLLHIESGPFGLNLNAGQPDRAVVAGFTSAADANRPVFRHCASFLPGSYIVSINKLSVVNHSLADVTGMLVKLKSAPKDVVVANAALASALRKRQSRVTVSVPAGPLGVHFDSARPAHARVAGFYAMPDGQPGAVEKSYSVPIGAYLRSVNSMNVSCLTLGQVSELLRKLSGAPKELVFHVLDDAQEATAKVVHILVPPGSLGIDLKSSISNRVVVDRVNQDPALGSTFIFEHGGVVPGSEIVAIDGFNVTSLEMPEVTQLLRVLAAHEKTITFSTTADAHAAMVSLSRSPTLKSVVVTRSPMGAEFDASSAQKAVIAALSEASELGDAAVPVGSRLVALEQVDLRALSVKQIARILKDFAGIPKTLMFDTAAASRDQSFVAAPGAEGTPVVPTPAPLQLAPLSIKPLGALKSLGESANAFDQKQQQQSAPRRNEFMINMITAAKAPTSPRSSTSAGTTVLFSDIVALDIGSKSEKGGGVPVAIATAKSRKPLEFEMRSREERQELVALLTAVAPALADAAS
ncbi:hypothetical protein PybrP1_004310 [[Pythium] brassicae (nom. inval.)]|nr:hypothetical protein PybrP1_004310 [[Pythium] brassicae (nom. inval.)]